MTTDHPIHVALRAIGEALGSLRKPDGKLEVVWPSPLGEDGDFIESTEYTFAPQTPVEQRHRVTVEEGLIGAAIALAQTYLDAKGASGRSAVQWNLWHVANYWKHRGTSGLNAKTQAKVIALGATQPLVPAMPGELLKVAGAALGQPFDVGALWSAIK
jgi:hypothetical protein